jgi:hypothetical protein
MARYRGASRDQQGKGQNRQLLWSGLIPSLQFQ